MNWNPKPQPSLLGAVALGLLLAGCAGAPAPGGYEEEGPLLVQVENMNRNRVVIYAVSRGVRHRLGEVETNATETFQLPQTVNLLDLRILVDPIGPRGTYLTGEIVAGPGDLVEVTVHPNLNLTSVSVR